jgi:FKBP-type peptidyl-prolyl cis-trans isomerase
MNYKIVVTILIGTFLFAGCKQSSNTAKDLKKDEFSYAIGSTIGADMKNKEVDLNPDKVAQGLIDAFNGKSKMSDEESKELLQAFQKQMMDKNRKKQEAIGKINKEEGESFLAKNKAKKGIVTLPSGLQYRIIKKGKGKISPKATNTVSVHYSGRTIDGKEFDSSYKRGKPAQFPLKGVIPGWIKILQLMKPGDKWEVFIPSELGYGQRGAGRDIGPNAVLIFDIELISIVK